jgi:hypothetical protein
MAKKENKDISEEIKEDTKKAIKFTSKHYWMIATISLAIVLLIILSYGSFSGIGKTRAGELVQSLISEQYGVDININNITIVNNGSLGKLYFVEGEYQGQVVEAYVSRDGKYLIPSIIPITAPTQTTTVDTPASTDVPKSDKPSNELFIWSYCPYGVTALTPFAEVAKLLGDKADFKVVLYYDGHGAHETQQNKIQACIQKYDKAKYWDYAIQFASKVYTKCSGDATCDKTESTTIMKSLGIDSAKIFTCVNSEGASLTAADSARAQSLGVTGSPSLVINGVIVQAARTAEAYKTEVCNAFNSAPASCGSTLSSTAGTTSGSC